jgi:hypothetical protein
MMKTMTREEEELIREAALESPEAAEQDEDPERRLIAELAYRYWEGRGCPHGTAEDDWYRAEREVRGKAA